MTNATTLGGMNPILMSLHTSFHNFPVPSPLLTFFTSSSLDPYSGERSRYEETLLMVPSACEVLKHEWMIKSAKAKNIDERPPGCSKKSSSEMGLRPLGMDLEPALEFKDGRLRRVSNTRPASGKPFKEKGCVDGTVLAYGDLAAPMNGAKGLYPDPSAERAA